MNNLTVIPLNASSALINWSELEEQCVVNYTITIISSNKNITISNTNITIPDLIIGSNYSFIIISIDTAGREGPPSSSIQYIWNGITLQCIYSLYFL